MGGRMIAPATNLNCTRNPKEVTATDPYARQHAYYARKRAQRLAEGQMVVRASDRLPGEKSLIVAVVEQALADYFLLRRIEAVKWRKVTGKWKDRKQGGKTYQNLQPHDAQVLIDFLEHDVGKLFDIADVNLPGSLVWEGILKLEKTGRWRSMFGRGVSEFVGSSDKGGV